MEIVELPVEDEWPHRPGPEQLWQESIVLTWQDVGQSLGGVIRLGQHPNRGMGICTFGIVEKNGQCFNRSSSDIALSSGDRYETGFSIDNFLRAEFATGSSRWTAHDADCDFELEVTDLHPLYDTWALSGLHNSFREKFAASHTEVAGLVRGSVRLGDRHWTVSGFGYRDHSWGIRDHSDPATTLVNLFWLVGSFGKDMVICACETIAANASRFSTGFVIKDGLIDKPIVRDIAFVVDADGISTRGAQCNLETAKFGTFDLEIDGFGNTIIGMQGDATQAHSYLECGMPGIMRCGDLKGAVHLSTMFNARNATAKPALLFGASTRQGLYMARHWMPSRSV